MEGNIQCISTDLELLHATTTTAAQPHHEVDIDIDPLLISMNALTRNTSCSTIRIQGSNQGKLVTILVDSGNTHSFITDSWATEGADWMHKYSPIIMDFKAITLKFQSARTNIILQGGKKLSAVKLNIGAKMEKEVVGELYFLETDLEGTTIPIPIRPLQQKFKGSFEESTTLLPQMSQAHFSLSTTPLETLYKYKSGTISWNDNATVENIQRMMQQRRHEHKLLQRNFLKAPDKQFQKRTKQDFGDRVTSSLNSLDIGNDDLPNVIPEPVNGMAENHSHPLPQLLLHGVHLDVHHAIPIDSSMLQSRFCGFNPWGQ
ncbi:hypothetical protein GQ457_01G027750 [Hibiscus cannabinus]